MSSPNEPGHPRAGDGGANGSGSGSGPEGGALGGAASRGPLPGGSPERIADATDLPPWQRGAAREAQPANRPAEAPARRETPPRSEAPRGGNGGATGHSPGVDARLNRFLSGGAASAPPQEQDAAGWADPPEPPRPEPPARPDTATARAACTARGDRPARAACAARGDRPARAARAARGERPARCDRTARGDPTARADRPARAVRQRAARPVRARTAARGT